MGRSEESGPQARLLKDPSGLRGNRALTVAASYVDSFNFVLRVPEVSAEDPHVIEVGFFPWSKSSH